MAEFLLTVTGDTALTCTEYLGRTPLHYSALVTDGDRDIYDWLVELGADASVTDSEGKTPEDYLQEKSSTPNLQGKLMELPEAPRLGLSGRKSPSKRGGSPSKFRESSPSKTRDSSPTKNRGRGGSKVRREDKNMVLVTPLKVTRSQVEEWAKAGHVTKLETAVLQGYGDLVTGIGKVWNEEARTFIKKVPGLMVGLVVYIELHLITNFIETN